MSQKIAKNSITHCKINAINFKTRIKICNEVKGVRIVHNHIDTSVIPKSWQSKTYRIIDAFELMSIRNINSTNIEIINRIKYLKNAVIFIAINNCIQLEKILYQLTTFAKYYKLCLIMEFAGNIDIAMLLAKYSDAYMWAADSVVHILKNSRVYRL